MRAAMNLGTGVSFWKCKFPLSLFSDMTFVKIQITNVAGSEKQ